MRKYPTNEKFTMRAKMMNISGKCFTDAARESVNY
jgi:hypothetical protein